jgi:hypothetical protein
MWTVCFDRLYGTGINAGCLLTLTTSGHEDVNRPVGEGVLLDLNACKTVRGLSFVGQGAGHHAGATALTFLQIDEEEPL